MDVQTEVATHTINILRVAEGQRQAAVDRLVELQGDLTTALEKSEGLSQNRLAKLNALLKQTDASIAAGYTDIGGSHAAGLKKIAAIEAQQAIKIVNGQIGVPVVSAMIPEKQLETIVDGNHIFGHSSKDWWAGQATDLQTKFRGIVQQGVLLGQSVDEMARKVRGTKAAGYEDGIMAAKKREAAALVRSAAISVSNEARLRQFKELGDVVKGIQWACFVPGTMVEQPDKWIAIEQIKPGDTVIGGTGQPRRVTAVSSQKRSKMARLRLSNGQTLVCTADHRFLTDRGWIQAHHLHPGEPFASHQSFPNAESAGPNTISCNGGASDPARHGDTRW